MEVVPLFVYGTLMRHEPAFRYLAAVSQRSARAKLPQALLYSTGRYPIAVDGDGMDGDGVVHGEVHWIAPLAAAELLTQLDRYEGDEYERVQRRVILVTGAALTAWVYLGEPIYAATHRPILSGDWRERGHSC